jgi:putative hemolysin
MDIVLEIGIILGLFVLNGFFALAEMAMVSSRRIRLQHMAEQGNQGAARAAALLANPGRFLSAVQVGITAIAILSGAVGGATLGARLAPLVNQIPGIAPHGPQVAVALVVIAITALSVVIGELVPKRIALSNPERIAAWAAQPLHVLTIVARPFVWLLEITTGALLTILRVPERSADVMTEEEVRFAIAEGREAGVIDEVEQQMIHGVLALADRPIAAIMTPRPDIYWIDLDDAQDITAREIADCPYSRVVVARGGDLGHALGVVQKKDLLGSLIAGNHLQIEKHLLEPLYVPEGVSVLQTLEIFRRTPVHVAFVLDEYGDLLGLATLTDVMEAIAGQLPEEHETPSEAIVQRPDGSWLVDGRVAINELVARLGMAEPGGAFHTVAGLALHHLARIPVEGDRFEIAGWRVEVIDMDGRRIDKLLFMPAQPLPVGP